jgi:hypothetical protein
MWTFSPRDEAKVSKLQDFRRIISYYPAPEYLSDDELEYFTLQFAQENFSEEMTEAEAMRAINSIELYVSSHNVEWPEKNYWHGESEFTHMMDRTRIDLFTAENEGIERFTWGSDFKNGYPYFDVKEYSPTECHILVSCIKKTDPSGEAYALALDAKLRYLLRSSRFNHNLCNDYLKKDFGDFLRRLRNKAIDNKNISDFAKNCLSNDPGWNDFHDWIDADATLDYYPPYYAGNDAPSFADADDLHQKDPLHFLYRRLPYKMITIKYDEDTRRLVYSESKQFFYNSMRPVLAAKYDMETINNIKGINDDFYRVQHMKWGSGYKRMLGKHEESNTNLFILFQYKRELTNFTFWFYDKYIHNSKDDIPDAALEEKIEELYRKFKNIPAKKPIVKNAYFEVYRDNKLRELKYNKRSNSAAKVIGFGDNEELMESTDYSDTGIFGSHPTWIQSLSEHLQQQYYKARQTAGLTTYDNYWDSYIETIGLQEKFLDGFRDYDSKYGLIDYVPFISNISERQYIDLVHRFEESQKRPIEDDGLQEGPAPKKEKAH